MTYTSILKIFLDIITNELSILTINIVLITCVYYNIQSKQLSFLLPLIMNILSYINKKLTSNKLEKIIQENAEKHSQEIKAILEKHSQEIKENSEKHSQEINEIKEEIKFFSHFIEINSSGDSKKSKKKNRRNKRKNKAKKVIYN